jgi:hypothetical protein
VRTTMVYLHVNGASGVISPLDRMLSLQAGVVRYTVPAES